MGLDIVEFAMSVEDAFGVRIEDEVWSEIRTPGQLIDCVSDRLPRA